MEQEQIEDSQCQRGAAAESDEPFGGLGPFGVIPHRSEGVIVEQRESNKATSQVHMARTREGCRIETDCDFCGGIVSGGCWLSTTPNLPVPF